MTLTWTPVPGASGYVLSWSPPAGKMSGWPQDGGQHPRRGLLIPLTVPWVAAGGERGQTLPSTASSQQVSGLRLGQRYTFTLRPLLGSAPGAEVSVSERTGTVGSPQGWAGLVSALVVASSLPGLQSAGMPSGMWFSLYTAPATAPLVPTLSAPSSPTPCPPWGTWALRAHR